MKKLTERETGQLEDYLAKSKNLDYDTILTYAVTEDISYAGALLVLSGNVTLEEAKADWQSQNILTEDYSYSAVTQEEYDAAYEACKKIARRYQ